jgi:hypothetical protein
LPPNLAVLRWHGCFEDDLVRGWIGRIEGLQTVDRLKRPIPSIQPLLKLLAKKQADDGSARAAGDGLWREEPNPPPSGHLFGRNRDGVDEFLIAIPANDGWDCILWQEQPRANSVHDSWSGAVHDGQHVTIARRKLRRHLLATRIPEDQQATARAILRQDPDAVEVGMLAETADAADGERRYAALACWVLGRGERPESGEEWWPVLAKGSKVDNDGRSVLVGIGEAAALVLTGFNELGELIIRDGQGTVRGTLAGGSVTAPGGDTLVVTSTDDGLTLTRR